MTRWTSFIPDSSSCTKGHPSDGLRRIHLVRVDARVVEEKGVEVRVEEEKEAEMRVAEGREAEAKEEETEVVDRVGSAGREVRLGNHIHEQDRNRGEGDERAGPAAHLVASICCICAVPDRCIQITRRVGAHTRVHPCAFLGTGLILATNMRDRSRVELRQLELGGGVTDRLG